MKHTRLLLSLLIPALVTFASIHTHAQNNSFTYQGSLKQNGTAANGNYDLQFALFTNTTGGTAVMMLTNMNVAVSNGLFVTSLDFSNSFNGTPYMLDIAVRSNGSVGTFSSIAPRQSVAASPYALFAPSAGNVTGIVAASNLPPTVAYVNSTNQTFTGNITAGSFSGDGSGLTNLSVSAAPFTNYYFGYDTTIQSFSGSVGTFQTINFNNALAINGGWILSPSGPSRNTFTAINSGIYLIEYQASLTGTAGRTASLRAVVNSIEVPGSQIAVSLGTNTVTSVSKSFIASVGALQVLQLQFTTDNLSMNISTGGVGTTKPSISLSILRLN